MKEQFQRDPNNPGSIINTDNSALQGYKLQKQHGKSVVNTQKQIDKINTELSEIKHLLQSLLERAK